MKTTYKITRRPITDRGQFTSDTFTSDLPLEEFLKKVKEGDNEVWQTSFFGIKTRGPRKVEHYVKGRFCVSGKGTSRYPEFVMVVEGPITLRGQVSRGVEFYKNLHDRLWAAVDKEFTKEEIAYLDVEVRGTEENDDRMIAYKRHFDGSHFVQTLE